MANKTRLIGQTYELTIKQGERIVTLRHFKIGQVFDWKIVIDTETPPAHFEGFDGSNRISSINAKKNAKSEISLASKLIYRSSYDRNNNTPAGSDHRTSS